MNNAGHEIRVMARWCNDSTADLVLNCTGCDFDWVPGEWNPSLDSLPAAAEAEHDAAIERSQVSS